MLYMFQCLYTYVASVYLKCFIRMLQRFYLDVAFVAAAIHICKRMFTCFIRMMQKCLVATLAGAAVPICATSEAGVDGPHLHAH
jgi:hypothetical protein